jgi:hypothetical protein
LRSALAPWGPPNTKKSKTVAFEQQSTRGSARLQSCQFDEDFNRLTFGGMPALRDGLITVWCHKKNSCNTPRVKRPVNAPSKAVLRRNQAYRTVACGEGKVAPFAGYSGEIVIVLQLDQPVPRVYSPIIRMGLSPPSQLSALSLVVTGKGFLCLRCKAGGNLVDRLCVSCGCSCSNSARSHHILWSAPKLFLHSTVVLRGGSLL